MKSRVVLVVVNGGVTYLHAIFHGFRHSSLQLLLSRVVKSCVLFRGKEAVNLYLCTEYDTAVLLFLLLYLSACFFFRTFNL